MADDVQITAGTGTTIATDERTIATVAKHVQRVDEQGSTTLGNAHVTVTSSSTEIAAARDTRKRVIIYNLQTVPIYVGGGTVTTSAGIRLDPGAVLTLYTTAAVNGITAAAYTASGEDTKVHFIEEYDS